MNPVIKVAIAVAFVAIVLWWAIGEFLGGTDEVVESLDVRSLSYLRDSDGSQNTASLSSGNVQPNGAESRSANSVVVHRDTVTETQSTANDEAATAMPIDSDDAAQNLDTVSDLADPREETEAEARARRLKETLGIKKPKPPTRAVDVELVLSSECDGSGVAMAPVSVQYRFESPTIRGSSLNQLEILVAEFRDCPDSVFQLTENVLGKIDATPTLTQMRFDELKYFFIQHSVPKTALRYPDSS